MIRKVFCEEWRDTEQIAGYVEGFEQVEGGISSSTNCAICDLLPTFRTLSL